MLFPQLKMRHSSYWGRQRNSWSEARTPNTTITVYAKDGGDYQWEIHNANKKVLHQGKGTFSAGLNYISYDLSIYPQGLKAWKNKKQAPKTADNGKVYLPKGKYTLVLSQNGEETQTSLTID